MSGQSQQLDRHPRHKTGVSYFVAERLFGSSMRRCGAGTILTVGEGFTVVEKW